MAGRAWIISATILGALAGGALGILWPKHYEAVAVMALNQAGADQQLNMDTERLIASSTAVMTLAAEELGASVGDVRGSVVVQLPRGATALEFAAERSDPDEASAYANAMAAAYSAQTQSANGDGQQEQLAIWEERVALLEEELAEAPDDSARAAAIRDRLTEAESNLLDVEFGPTGDTTGTATLISPAQASTTPASPGVVVFAAGGAVAGMLLGMCGAILSSRRTAPADTADIEFRDIVRGYQ